jgi:hypothetical protein
MPALTLVVCVHNQRDLLERLLQKAEGCYDDLVVVHDGPDETGIGVAVKAAGGRFFERPRAFQQEPHLPFAFGQTRHDWILHFDADEFPSEEMKKWLQEFRRAPEPPAEISGFTCIWPLWDGQRTVSKKWPAGRNFLFDRRKVRLFGMAEQAVVPDGQFRPVDLVLHHQPKRKSYGLCNILVRKQAYHWRRVIVQSLLGKPTDLPCWRWESENWPVEWERIRQHPLQTALRRLVMETLRDLRSQWRTERKLNLEAAVNAPIHHALICFEFRRLHSKMAGRKRGKN